MKVNVDVEPGLLSICPTPSPPGPFIYVARSQGAGGIRYRLQYRYTTWTRILTNITIGLSLTILRGTQLTGSIIYTLVSSPRDSTRIADSGWISDLQIFDLINTWLLQILKSLTWSFDLSLLWYLARGFDEQAWQLWWIKRSVNCRNRYLSPTSNSISLDLNSVNRLNTFFCRI
jgi:hypothetical protein